MAVSCYFSPLHKQYEQTMQDNLHRLHTMKTSMWLLKWMRHNILSTYLVQYNYCILWCSDPRLSICLSKCIQTLLFFYPKVSVNAVNLTPAICQVTAREMGSWSLAPRTGLRKINRYRCVGELASSWLVLRPPTQYSLNGCYGHDPGCLIQPKRHCGLNFDAAELETFGAVFDSMLY